MSEAEVEKVEKRGGFRPGAGRKRLEVKRNKFITYVTTDEQAAIKKLIDQMRNGKPEAQSDLLIEEQTVFDFDTQESNKQIELNALESKYEDEIATLKLDHEDKIREIKTDCEYEISTLKSKFEMKVHEIKKNHQNEINEMKADYENEINILQSEREDVRGRFAEVLTNNHQSFLDLSESIQKAGQEIVNVQSKKLRVQAYDKNIEPLSARLIKLGINLQNALSRLP